MALNLGLDELFPKSGRGSDREGTRVVRKATAVVGFDESAEYGTIQEAINDLPREGGEVFIKEGTYILKEPITITKDNIILRGNSWGAKIDAINLGAVSSIIATNKDNIQIENLNITDSGASGGTGITLTNCDNARVKNCLIDNGNDGIEFNDCDFGVIENNRLELTGGDFSIKCETTSKNCVIKNNRVNNGASVWLEGADHCTIEGNVIDNGDIDGAIAITDGNNNTINNNIVFTTGEGINLFDSDNNIINSNRVDAFVGIFINNSTCDKNLIVGNNLVGSTTPLTDNGTNTTSANNNS